MQGPRLAGTGHVSAVSLTATALAGAVLGCAVVGLLGQVVAARAEVDAAADLAALAVAAHVVRGEPQETACAVGDAVAAGPRTRLIGCVVAGDVVTVQVVRDLDLLGATLPVAAAARAGLDTGTP